MECCPVTLSTCMPGILVALEACRLGLAGQVGVAHDLRTLLGVRDTCRRQLPLEHDPFHGLANATRYCLCQLHAQRVAGRTAQMS